jgi:hypothetical protein
MGSRPGIVLALLVAVVFCVYLATITDGMPITSTDWAMYVMHARNILHGIPYSDTGYIVQPETTLEGPNSYPSGLPLMLVPAYAALGLNIRAFKIVCDGALALSLWPIYLFSRRFLPAASALLAALATAFGSLYINTHNVINSDSPYQLLSFAAIVFVLWVCDGGRDISPRGWLWGVPAGLALATAYLTRPIGIAIVLAVLIAQLIRRRRISAFMATLSLTFLALVLLNNSMFHKDSSYKDEFILSPVLMVRNAMAYLGYLSYLFANPFSNKIRYVLFVPSLLLALNGIRISFRRFGLTLVELYWAILLGVLSVYWVPNPRYLLPLMPIFLVYILLGAEAVLGRIPTRYRPGLQWAAAALLLVAPACNLLRIRTFNQDTLIATPAFDQLCMQIAERTGAHDYLLFWSPRVLALYTGRSYSAYPLSDPQQVQRFLDRVQPKYIVLDKDCEDDRKYLIPVIDPQPKRYKTIFENEQFKLAQVGPSAVE